MAAMLPTTIIVTLRPSGAFSSSPSLRFAGGFTRASALPTAIAAPNASTRSGSRSSPSSIDHLHRWQLGCHRDARDEDAGSDHERAADEHEDRGRLLEQEPPEEHRTRRFEVEQHRGA